MQVLRSATRAQRPSSSISSSDTDSESEYDDDEKENDENVTLEDGDNAPSGSAGRTPPENVSSGLRKWSEKVYNLIRSIHVVLVGKIII